MAFNRYYKDELSYLRELGEEFAHDYPKLAPFLGGRSNDPDVERLLEGFAFLTARLREKLDDDLPELTHALMMLLWPHYLRSVPSATILQFEPIAHAVSDRKRIARGTHIDSRPVEGTRCRFRTCQAVDLLPLRVETALLADAAEGAALDLTLTLEGTAGFPSLDIQKLRFHLHGEPFVTQSLFLWLNRYLAGIDVQDEQGRCVASLPPAKLSPSGFDSDQAMLPYPQTAFAGYRYLQEFFSFPDKFLFIDIDGLAPLASLGPARQVTLRFRFSRTFDDDFRVRASNFRLNCTPAVNLFARDAVPVRLDHRRVEYRVRPEGADPSHYEVYAVDGVDAWQRGTGARREYKPFESFDHRTRGPDGGASEVFYRLRTQLSVGGRGLDHYISVVHSNEAQAGVGDETLSLTLTCSNRRLAEQLEVGDIHEATADAPNFATCRNITPVTGSVAPPLDNEWHWRLISNMGLNYVSLANIESLRVILSAYDFRSFSNRPAARAAKQRLDALHDIQVEPKDRLYRGLPVRGLAVRLDMHESGFTSEGEMFLLGTVLNEFLALYANINSFLELTVRGIDQGEVYTWPVKAGQQSLL